MLGSPSISGSLSKRLVWPQVFVQPDVWIASCITFIGMVLRIHQYAQVPAPTFTFDEYAFAWSGMSLWKEHVPTSWSYLAAYNTETLNPTTWLGKDNLYLVTPWFDHPPLFGLLIGGFAILAGANTFTDCTTELIRIPALVLGGLSVFTFYFVAKHLLSRQAATIATLIFATNPLLVMLSRMAVSENLLVLLALGSLLCVFKYLETSKTSYLYALTLLTGLAPLVKVTGLFLVGSIFLIMMYNKRYQAGAIVLAAGIAAFGLYFAYGALYDFDLFLTVLRSHSKRFDSIMMIKELIFSGNSPFADAWLILGWISLPYTLKAVNQKWKTYCIALPVVVYVSLLTFSGAQSHFYCWYMIPLYPFLLLSLGHFFEDAIRRPSFLTSGMIVLCVGVWCLHYGIGNPWSDFYLLNLRGFKYLFIFTIAAALAPVFLWDVLRLKQLKTFTRQWTLGTFFVCILLNGIITYNLGTVLQSNLLASKSEANYYLDMQQQSEIQPKSDTQVSSPF
jgi:4-amino-4-deoxy-L-arabinose transferase-like glycosyltransferase